MPRFPCPIREHYSGTVDASDTKASRTRPYEPTTGARLQNTCPAVWSVILAASCPIFDHHCPRQIATSMAASGRCLAKPPACRHGVRCGVAHDAKVRLLQRTFVPFRLDGTAISMLHRPLLIALASAGHALLDAKAHRLPRVEEWVAD